MDKPNTVFLDRYRNITGKDSIEVMPVAPEKVIVEVYNQPLGMMSMNGGFRVGQIIQKSLQDMPECINYGNPKIKNAILFTTFSAQAGFLDAAETLL